MQWHLVLTVHCKQKSDRLPGLRSEKSLSSWFGSKEKLSCILIIQHSTACHGRWNHIYFLSRVLSVAYKFASVALPKAKGLVPAWERQTSAWLQHKGVPVLTPFLLPSPGWAGGCNRSLLSQGTSPLNKWPEGQPLIYYRCQKRRDSPKGASVILYSSDTRRLAALKHQDLNTGLGQFLISSVDFLQLFLP